MTDLETKLVAALHASNVLLVAASFYVPQELASRMSDQLDVNDKLVLEAKS